jgi:hypothetical protein
MDRQIPVLLKKNLKLSEFDRKTLQTHTNIILEADFKLAPMTDSKNSSKMT